MSIRALIVAAALAVAAVPALTFAQAGPGGGGQGQGQGGPGGQQGGQQGGRGQRGNFDPAAFQQQMMDRMKTDLKATDDEWKVIQPKLEKVMTAQRDSRTGWGGGRGGRGGGPGGPGGGGNTDPNAPASPLQTASGELRATLEKEGSTPEEIAAKLTAYRDARDKARANLEAARKDLKEVLTPRQEAALVLQGTLE